MAEYELYLPVLWLGVPFGSRLGLKIVSLTGSEVIAFTAAIVGLCVKLEHRIYRRDVDMRKRLQNL